MDIMAAQLKHLQPDIVACQECFISENGNADTLKFLADKLGMNYLFASGREKKRRFEGKLADSLSGLGVLSRYPIVSIETFDLPVTPEDDDRKAQQVAISLPGGKKMLITNVHLTHLRNAVSLRTAQAAFVADKTISANNYDYKIVCGDFNAQVNSTETNAFLTRANGIDCYTAGSGTEPRDSLIEALKHSRHICVDHIFALPKPNGTHPKFTGSAAVLNEPDPASGIYPSDHFGICTTLITD
jgi:endonuclease/exonuclease/phosphatase family metal-dependent hydrolase